MQISDKIAYLRKQKGWSQEQLAAKLDVSRQAVYKWEANMTYPEIDKLKKLALMFDVSFNDFFDDNIDITKKEEKQPNTREDEHKKEETDAENSQPNDENADGVAENPPKKREVSPEQKSERNKKIAIIIAIIVAVITCAAVAIWAFCSITQKNTDNPNPPTYDSGNEGGSNGENEYFKVTCKVLGELYSEESVLKGSTYEPEFLGVEGYTFEGWMHGSELWDVENSKVTRNIILIAILTPKINTVIFHANDGTSNKWEREFETGIGVLISGPDYIRDGYTFKGYSYTSDGQELMTVGEHFTVKAGTSNLYAIWEKNSSGTATPTYNIKYNLDGGENSPFNPTTYSGTEPVLLREPTKEFYTFVGWYSDSLYRNKVAQIENITDDMTYFAKWDYLGYTATYNLSTNSVVLERVDPNYEGFFEIPSEAYGGYPVTNIGADAFFGCKKITEIYIPSSIKSIENTAFLGTDSLAYIDVDTNNSSFSTYNGDLYIKPRTRLIRYATGKTEEGFILPTGCTYVNDYAFYGSKNLKSLDISESSGIGKFALAECASLETVKVGQILNFIDAYAFKKCGLTELTVESDLYSIGNFAFSECPNLLNLTFNGSIGEIGWSAFKSNGKLTSVVFNGSVEKLSTNLFESCVNLRSVAIPDGIKLINKYMFKGCNNLASVSIPESVTLIEDGAFDGCFHLKQIYISLGVNEIQGSPFYNCSDLTIYCQASSKPSKWDDNWNISNCPVVWDINGEGSMYEGISYSFNTDGTITVTGGNEVEHIVIPEAIDGKIVTKIMPDAFKNHTTLKTVTIYARDINVGLYAFEGCTSIEAVYVSDIDAWLSIEFQDATANPLHNGAELYIGGWGKYEKLTKLTVPNYVDTINKYAFYGCTSLERVEFHENMSSLCKDCFKDCTTIKYVVISDPNKWCEVEIESLGANPMIYSLCEYVSNVKITSLNLDVKTVGDYCFAGCAELTEVTLSVDTTTRIGKGAFSDCIALESIGIPKIVTYVGKGAFENCTILSIYYESLEKPNGWDTNWNISNCPVYYGCLDSKTEYYIFSQGQITNYVGSSSSIVIPSEINGQKVTSIVEGAFTNNKNIVSIVLPSSIITIDERAFYGCDKLETVIISEGVKIIGEGAFESCKSLKSIVIPSTAQMIYGSTFKGCTGLKEITFAQGIISVCADMLSGCTQLETVNLPSTIETISQNAFYGCSSLKNIALPDGLLSIGRSAFDGCSSLTELFIPISVATIENFAFDDTSDDLVIKCEIDAQPDGWSYYVLSDKIVLWNQKRES